MIEKFSNDMFPMKHCTSTYTENEKTRKWMPTDHFFDCIEMLNPERYSEWIRCYALLANDLLTNNGIRVLDLEESMLRNCCTFGPDKAFFEEDRRFVMDFCRMVVIVY
jgi:hypothetical protein